MEENENEQDQKNQEGEELLKMLGVEDETGGGEGKEVRNETKYVPNTLLSLTEISRQTGIMYTTLKRYGILYDSTDLKGLWEGEGRGKKYYPEAIEVFKRLKAESKKGRPRGPQSRPDIAPLAPKPALGRGNVEDPFALSSQKKGKKKGAKKGAVKRPGKPSVRQESSPTSIPASLSTQEADRAMAAIERVQLMARYEAVKDMIGTWVWEMERLEKVLGLGREEGK